MPTWPTELPSSFLSNGFDESGPNLSIETEMEKGPKKRRKRSSYDVGKIRGTMRMTTAQYSAYKTFYYDTINVVEAFDFPDPDSAGTIKVRFPSSAVPQRQYSAPGLWNVPIELEVL